MSSPRRGSRVCLSARGPSPSTPDQSDCNQGQAPLPSSGSFRLPSPPPSPPITPLTPHNTFSDGFDFEPSVSPDNDAKERSIDLGDLEDELLRDAMYSEYDFEEDEDDNDSRPSDTRSEPPPDTSGSSDNTVIHTRPLAGPRSKSVPPRPLKSALAIPTPITKIPGSEHCGRKRAHFDEDPLTAEFSLLDVSTEPTVIRRCTTPDRADLMRRILSRDSFSEHAQSLYTDSSGYTDDAGLAAAIELFEEVVEELVQVAEEHAEAHEELAVIAHEVAEAILHGRRNKNESEEADWSENDDQNEEPHPLSAASSPGIMRQTSADEDVDESCIGDPDIDLGFDEDVQPPSEVIFWAENDEIEESQLVPITEEMNSSTETLTSPSSAVSEIINKRRVSDPQTNLLNLSSREAVRRRNSMTDFTKLKGRLRLLPSSPKASPAGCAVTVCSVRAAEAPKLNTVYEHPGARYKMFEGSREPTKMAQTVRSDAGTFQILWIDPPASSCSSDVTLLDSSGQGPGLIISGDEDIGIGTPSPMDRVRTKLAAWSWAREQGLDSEHGGPNWIPLLPCHDDVYQSPSGIHSPPSDEPFAPPNTERPSGASSAKHSAPHSPGPEEYDPSNVEDEDEDHPLELKVRAPLARPPFTIPPSLRKSQGDYLSLPVQQSEGSQTALKPISRELSNLPLEETHFKTHKNSLVLLHKQKDEGRMNQHLLNSRDSIVLTRSKLNTRYPKQMLDTKSTWSRHGALSPILDASPPDPQVEASLRTMERIMEGPERRQRRAQANFVDEAHPDEHVGCPICETERPRWCEAICKTGHFM